MGNLVIGIKRFFQNKNTVTILGILASVGIIYFAYNYRIKISTQPVNVPYATRVIGPRTLITKDMVAIKQIPGGVVTKNVVTATNQIIGKYVLNNAVIPENGLFYTSMIADWDDMPTSVFDKIGEGETVYALKVDMDTTYGNSIFPGNYIDIYYKTTKKQTGVVNMVWVGKFIESIRVLDVVDGNGKSVFETAGEPLVPNKILFNLQDKEWLLFKKIESMGITLFPVQRNANYTAKASEMLITGNEFQQAVESNFLEDSIINGGKKK